MRATPSIPAFPYKRALVLLLAGLAGCGSMGGQTAGGTSALPGSAVATSMSQADRKLVMDIAQADMAEIQTGKLALSKSQNAQVRAFAQKMVDDHGMALQELQRLAQAAGVSLPGDTDLVHKAVAAELGLLSGDTFDRQYMSQFGIADHQRTHELLEQTMRTADNPALRAHAAKVLPIVTRHLNQAQQASGNQ